jgi:S-DNA-T family DNA segregation ATPase FtsK/SpoIIIE
MPGEVNRKKHEVIGLLLLMVAVLLLLCLVSYNPHDSSFNALSLKLSVDNKIGKLGAYVSDFLFQILGFSAFYLLLPLLILSWKLIFGREIHTPFLRTLGLSLLIASTSALLELLPIRLANANFMPGGVIGVLIGDLLLPNLNRTGTVIVIAGSLVLGIFASTTLTLENSLSRLARKSASPVPSLWQRFQKWRENRKPVRTVVNIKPVAPPPLDLTPRPAPVKIPPAPPEIRSAPPAAPSREPETQRFPASAERSRARKFVLPPVDLLKPGENPFPVDEADLMERARMISAKCGEFDEWQATQIHPGPVATIFEFKPDAESSIPESPASSMICAWASRLNPSGSTGFQARPPSALRSRTTSGNSLCFAS